MPLETATYISDLDPTNPVGSSDLVSSLDDHVRLVKATLQTTFPGIAGAVTATHTELNFLDGVTGTTGTGKLVLDNAPTIAALTVTGSITLPARSVADAALSDNVPLKNAANTFTDSLMIRRPSADARLELWRGDVTQERGRWAVIVDGLGRFRVTARTDAGVFTGDAISISRDGTEVGTMALTADAITLNGVNVTDYARLSQPNAFTAAVNQFTAIGATTNVNIRPATGQEGYLSFTESGVADRWVIGIKPGDGTLYFGEGNTVSNTTRVSIGAGGAFKAPAIATSTSTTLAAGQVHAVTNNATLPNMTAGQWVGVINNSASPITVTKNASDTMYWTASGASVTSVTVAARGKATFFCADGANVYASGNITGSS